MSKLSESVPAQATLSQLLAQHLAQLASQMSARTCEACAERVTPFVLWCQQRGVQYAPQVSVALLERYQRYLAQYRKANGEPLAVSGQLSRLSALKSFFAALLKRHVILYNPAAQLTLPKPPAALPLAVLSEEETLNLLSAQPTDSAVGLRNRAILETFWSSGLRRQELANLRLQDINISRGTVLVHQGKNGKDRVVPIGDRAVSWVLRYQREARPQLSQRADSGHLFLSQRGGRLSSASLTQLVGRALRQQARLEKAGACHLLRHSMATQMLENGAETRYLQALLGHSSLNTTQVYTRVAIAPLKAEHERTHPGNKPALRDSQTEPTAKRELTAKR
ncbi:site-specific tyrosine recombinase XerC [Serratia microhaemolytica]|uniref:site-specific tyrosine recombinase XerC n=1 Tax=Serratia microhaemolytica TaxID=2675110 RepID=UPI000FDF45F2|nr:site-specific tyrosine recombinase XerC [Serratia microhaemolytica]